MSLVQQTTVLQTEACLASWQSTAKRVPIALPFFSAAEQKDNEQQIELLFSRITQHCMDQAPSTPRQRAVLAKRMSTAITRCLLRADEPEIQSFMRCCGNAGEEFTRTAWDFDPDLPDSDVLQALRNLWVFNSIQEYGGRRVAVTPSSFAYSMLYPYTDNTIDRGADDGVESRQFVEWLTRRLMGLTGGADTPVRKKVDRLLTMIEGEYPAQEFPEVSAAICAIHAAQAKSLSLRRAGRSCDWRERLSATIEKGGTSVLADGVLVTGSLNAPLAEAAFVYGVILQFIDDLQDIPEDCEAGHVTLFTRSYEDGSLAGETSRLLTFLDWCITIMQSRAPTSSAPLCTLIRNSCAHLILEAIAEQREYFDQRYVDAMRRHMPLGIEFFAGLKSRVKAFASSQGGSERPFSTAETGPSQRFAAWRRAMMSMPGDARLPGRNAFS